uniref:Uncharacterized protein n=1 Tax=Pelodiscus sinensis TaxID=13735 RepID=K7FEH3_PELSI
KKYNAFVVWESLIKHFSYLGSQSEQNWQVSSASLNENMVAKFTFKCETVSFYCFKSTCEPCEHGHVKITKEELVQDCCRLAQHLVINFLMSLLKTWQNMNTLCMKSTMEKPGLLL